jgi:hypothetical protein
LIIMQSNVGRGLGSLSLSLSLSLSTKSSIFKLWMVSFEQAPNESLNMAFCINLVQMGFN